MGIQKKQFSQPHTCSFPANLAAIFRVQIRGTSLLHQRRLTKLMAVPEILLDSVILLISNPNLGHELFLLTEC